MRRKLPFFTAVCPLETYKCFICSKNEILNTKITLKVSKIMPNITCLHKILNLDGSSKKKQNLKNLLNSGF